MARTPQTIGVFSGELLAEARAGEGLTLDALSRRISRVSVEAGKYTADEADRKFSQAQVSRWENDECVPSFEAAVYAARALRVRVEDFLA